MPEGAKPLTNRRRAAAWLLGLLAAAVVLFIWSNSLDSREDSARKSLFFAELVRPLILMLPVPAWHDAQSIHFMTRKLAHFVQFFALGALTAGFSLAIRPVRRLPALWIMAFCVGVAVVDELLQFISARAPAAADVMIDSMGALCGIACILLLHRLATTRRNRFSA